MALALSEAECRGAVESRRTQRATSWGQHRGLAQGAIWAPGCTGGALEHVIKTCQKHAKNMQKTCKKHIRPNEGCGRSPVCVSQLSLSHFSLTLFVFLSEPVLACFHLWEESSCSICLEQYQEILIDFDRFYRGSVILLKLYHCRMATFLRSYQIVGTSSTWTADVGRDVSNQYCMRKVVAQNVRLFGQLRKACNVSGKEDLIGGRCDMPCTRMYLKYLEMLRDLARSALVVGCEPIINAPCADDLKGLDLRWLSERLNMFEHCVNNLLMQEALEALRKDSKVSFWSSCWSCCPTVVFT